MSIRNGAPKGTSGDVEKKALLSIQKALDAWLAQKSGFYEMEVRPLLPEISRVVVAGLKADGVTLS
jgi:hypothetical protein